MTTKDARVRGPDRAHVTPEAAIYFRDQFRQARAAVVRDAEAFESLIHVIERLGMLLSHEMGDLGKYCGHLKAFAGRSPLARKLPDSLHTRFSKLYESVRVARNDAMHQGAFARHLTSHAVKLVLILEDALMNGCSK